MDQFRDLSGDLRGAVILRLFGLLTPEEQVPTLSALLQQAGRVSALADAVTPHDLRQQHPTVTKTDNG